MTRDLIVGNVFAVVEDRPTLPDQKKKKKTNNYDAVTRP